MRTARKPRRLRVAWLFPSLARGFYWQPVLGCFAKAYPQTIVYTGNWPGYLPGYEGAFRLQVVGKSRYFLLNRARERAGAVITLPPAAIVVHLARFRPQVLFTSGFSLWSLAALAAKAWLGSRVIVLYDGSSPSIDRLDSRFFLFLRRLMARHSDGFLTNTQAGRRYLTRVLGVKRSRVLAGPYEVPGLSALSMTKGAAEPDPARSPRPVFLVVSRLVPSKGLRFVLQACSTIKTMGWGPFSLIVVGEGPQRRSLQGLAERLGLQQDIHWAGWVDHHRLPSYFQGSDVLISPTLEDSWGMAVLEGMVFGKAILCSKFAGASELVVDGENGYVFDPLQVVHLARLMRRFIEDPTLAASMGAASRALIAPHTPEAAAAFLARMVERTAEISG